MNQVVAVNIFRFLFFLALQVLIFSNLTYTFGSGWSVQVLIYPLFILLLPMPLSGYLVLLLGFLTGLCVDLFYYTPGVHVGASVLTAYLRGLFLRLSRPQGRYAKDNPGFGEMSRAWLARYIGPLLFIHIGFYFALEIFSLELILKIGVNTILSFVASMIFVGIYLTIFKPKV